MTSGELDRVIHQPVRTQIVAYLANVKECDYTTLRDNLSLSDGHMSTHMKQLVEAEYIAIDKAFVNNKPKTTYRLTPEGKKKFHAYVKHLKEILGRSV